MSEHTEKPVTNNAEKKDKSPKTEGWKSKKVAKERSSQNVEKIKYSIFKHARTHTHTHTRFIKKKSE